MNAATYRPHVLPTQIIDPHIHQWDPLTTPRLTSREATLLRRLPAIPKAIRWLMPQADRHFIGDPRYVVKPYLPQDYRADAGDLPVASVVHIEAAWVTDDHLGTVDETRWVAALPFGHAGTPRLGAIVVHADPRWNDIADVLDAHLAASPLVRGVRYSATFHDDPGVRSFADRAQVLDSADFVRGFAAIAERRLSFELWLYAHQLPEAVALVREYPDTTFVLNHYATPVGIFGPRGKFTGRGDSSAMLDRWREDVAALAKHSNVVAKHSGLGMPLLGGEPRRPIDRYANGELTSRAAPLIEHVHAVFGPERTMWASNYPIDKPVHSIPASVQIILDVLGEAAVPQLLLHDVAQRTYRMASTS